MRRIADWLRLSKLGIILLPLLGSAAYVLVEKLSAMVRCNAFHEMAVGLRSSPSLYFWEKISLFRADMLFGFVLIPLAFSLLTFWLSSRRRIYLSIVAAFLVEALVTIELYAYLATGTFSSLRVLWFDLMWLIRSRETAFDTHPAVTLLFWGAGLVFAVLLAVITVVAFRRNIRWLNHVVLAVFGMGIVATAIAYLPSVPALPWSQSLLQMVTPPAFFENEILSGLDGHSTQQLLQRYREASHVPPPQPTSLTGKAKDYNVVMVVMESMAAQAFDPSRDSLSDMPNTRRLRDHAFVMRQHFTSYPLTDNAAFSIFTSLYVRWQCGIVDRQIPIPGLIRSLRSEGYETGYYGFVWSIPQRRDDLMLASLGFQKIAAAHIDPKIDESGQATFFGSAAYVAENDHRGLLALRADIRNWTARKQKFAAAYFPELSHDPYREMDGGISMPPLERGHALAVYQDAWLGELMDELQRAGALAHTIIMITGDHGMRWTPGPHEGQFVLTPRGRLEDIKLRTPMLIYVPGVLQQETVVESPTSHIDISPTLLDLLGISSGRVNEQGMPVYAPEIAHRRLFLQMEMFGATGYYYGGNYYSRSALGVVYKGPAMDFKDRNLIRFDSPEAAAVRNLIAAQDSNQTALVSSVLGQGYFH